MRVVVRGGSWRNSEDEILKAAVMKYGKNQWARIASLLHRKSALQCKTRWNEWLDPNIKKTEWSRDEDEKLLHMTKLMPTQWRTIAPIVGRTAAQCFERYEELLSKAQNLDLSESKTQTLANLNDLSKIKRVEMVPETKPALPDAVDMDEDELEMLSEARARLANTQGKKAKRKARERQLQESKRLSSLQRKRELLAAGINYRDKILKKLSIDYNKEIPFEKKPAPGFFDTSEEKFKTPDVRFGRVTTHDLDIKYRDIEEKNEKKRNKAKIDKKKDTDPSFLLDMPSRSKRSKLSLPEPTVSDEEIRNIIKLGKQNEDVQNYVLSMNEKPNEELGINASDNLLVNYEATPTIDSSVTSNIRTPLQSGRLMDEIVNQNILREQPTPLLRLKDSEISNTPNIKGTDDRQSTFEKTPNSIFSKINSDRLHINTPASHISQNQISAEQTPDYYNRSEELKTPSNSKSKASQMQMLHEMLDKIPEPKSEFDITLSNYDDNDDNGKIGVATLPKNLKKNQIPDQEEVNEKELSDRQLSNRSMVSDVHHRNLPRPSIINAEQWTKTIRSTDNIFIEQAEKKVKQQMLYLAYRDAKYGDSDGQTISKNIIKSSDRLKEKKRCDDFIKMVESYEYEKNDMITDDDLAHAKELIDNHLKTIKPKIDYDLLQNKFYKIWDECLSQITFIPDSQSFITLENANKKQLLDSNRWWSDKLKTLMKLESKNINRIDNRLSKLHGGYIKRYQKILREINQTAEELDVCQIEKQTYENLYEYELKNSIPSRIETVKKLVDEQKAHQIHLQNSYALKKKLQSL